MQEQGTQEEEAARLLGANGWQMLDVYKRQPYAHPTPAYVLTVGPPRSYTWALTGLPPLGLKYRVVPRARLSRLT